MIKDRINIDYMNYTIEDIREKIKSPMKEDRLQVTLALFYNEYDSIVDLLKELIVNDVDPTIREMAIITFSKLKVEDYHHFLKKISKTYKERNNFVKARALWALSECSCNENYEVFLEALNNENWELCYWSIMGLVNITEKELPLKELTLTFKTATNELIRQTITWAFAIRKTREAVKFLTDIILKDKNAGVRLNAAWALNKINFIGSVPAINFALKNELNSLVKRELIIALGNILNHKTLSEHEITADLSIDNLISETIRTLSMVLQRDSNYYIRRTCAESLGKIKNKQASDVLLAVFTSDVNQFVRKFIAEALGEIKDEEALPSLQKAMKSQYKMVAQAAAEAILKIKSANI